MRLLRIARRKWDVLAVLSGQDRCQVIDFLTEHCGQNPDEQDLTTFENACALMLGLIREHIPVHGAPEKMPLCKPLGGGLFEFRKQPSGDKLRVTWFRDNKMVICVLAFSKRSTRETKPRDAVNKSRKLKKTYFEDKRRSQIVIEQIPEGR